MRSVFPDGRFRLFLPPWLCAEIAVEGSPAWCALRAVGLVDYEILSTDPLPELVEPHGSVDIFGVVSLRRSTWLALDVLCAGGPR